MKKKLAIIIPIILIIIIAISLIIGSGEKEEYKLIELTGTELMNTLLEDEKVSITFALYNDRDVREKEYLEALEKTVRVAKENIYYVNTNFTSFEFEEIFSALTESSINGLSYYVIQDGDIVLSNTFKGEKTTFKDLNGKKYDTKIIKTSKKEKLESIKKAQEAYAEGNIGEAKRYLGEAWNTKEAKAEYQRHSYYNIIGNWELFEPDDDMKKTKYTNIQFWAMQSYFSRATKEGKIKGFEKPEVNEYTNYEFKILNNEVYLKGNNDKDFKKEYKIILVNKYLLVLEDNNGKTLNFQYGF